MTILQTCKWGPRLKRSGWTQEGIDMLCDWDVSEKFLEFLEKENINKPRKTPTKFSLNDFLGKTNEDKTLRIKRIDENFRLWLFDKEEDVFVGERELSGIIPKKFMHDEEILKYLHTKKAGGEVELQDIFHLLLKQGLGQEGKLLITGKSNIFFVRDVDNYLRKVKCYWARGGWWIRAGAIDWIRRGDCVFFRKK